MNEDLSTRKQAIRESVWARLVAERQAAFPFPIRGRIPNFRGASAAAARLAEQPEFERARVVKVNPDAPQRPVRQRVLDARKLLLMPTPRLRGGFVVVDPARLDAGDRARASSIAGAFALGSLVPLVELPAIDLIVFGTVAVTARGARVGKGEGYAELEYATLRTLGRVGPNVPIATTVHDAQIVDSVPIEPFDVPVDLIVTPTRVIRCEPRLPKPSGVLWEYLSDRRLEEMPVLQELRRAGGDS
ncbi:MAG TPA: 5-formyltetrahydrofolate cyclo-ligase [Chloroflexota bacterium]|nr:5-formyltetrahydrofolate cyclo-ligase [Chloroflexota bacterium]